MAPHEEYNQLINEIKKQARQLGRKITDGEIATALNIESATFSRIKGGKVDVTEKHITALKRAIPDLIPEFEKKINVTKTDAEILTDLVQLKASNKALNSIVAELLAKDRNIEPVEAMAIIQERMTKYLIGSIQG